MWIDNEDENFNTSSDESSSCSSRSKFEVPDKLGNVALHVVVFQNELSILNHTFLSEEILDFLLQQENIDLNIQNGDGYTPLHLSIVTMRVESFIMRFIEAGCNINIPNTFRTTPLHSAVMNGQMDHIVHELIKRGADIDAQDEDNGTPLHYAVEGDNEETLCILLYHGADVNILDKEKRSPFTNALFDTKLKTARILYDYCDDFDNKDEDGYTALHLASLCDSSLTIKMVEAGADVNSITDDGCSVLEFSLLHNDALAFKTIWPRLDYQSLFMCSTPILYSYIRSRNHYQAHEWLECMYLILNSSIALELMEHCNKYIDKINGRCSFFQELLSTFFTLGIKANDRLTIINICLTLGAEVYNIRDLDFALKFYGFNEELEMLIYMTDIYNELSNYNIVHPLLPLILAVEDFRTETVFNLCKKQIQNVTDESILKERLNFVIHSLGFFSLPYYLKQELLQWYQSHMNDCHGIARKLEAIPEIPTLQELCRNQTHKFIRQTGAIKKPYHFHDAVKKLKLPQSIKDVIRFKKPLF